MRANVVLKEKLFGNLKMFVYHNVGVKNITALGNVVQWQKVDYDFQFHKQEFKCDIPVLILSEGRSLVQVDCCHFKNYY